MILRSCWRGAAALLVLWCAATAAPAQTDALPTPFEAYGEDDPSAVAPKRIDPTDNRARQTLEQILQYDPENVNARIQNAELLIARGVRQRGLDEFAYALRLAGSDEKKLRSGGVSREQIQSAVRIASVIHAVAGVLEYEAGARELQAAA